MRHSPQGIKTFIASVLSFCLFVFSVPVQAQVNDTTPTAITRENIHQLHLLSQATLDSSPLFDVAFRSDGTIFTTVPGRHPAIFTYAMEEHELIPWGLAYGPYEILAEQPTIQFFNEEKNLALTGNGAIVIWSVPDNKITSVIYQSFVSDMISLGLGRILVWSGESRLLAIWNVPTNIPSQSPDAPPLPEDYEFVPSANLVVATQLDDAIVDVVYDSLSRYIFVLTRQGVVYQYLNPPGFIIDKPEMLLQPTQTKTSERIASSDRMIALNPEEQWIAYAGSGRDIVIYDYLNHRFLLHYPMESPVICVIHNPNTDLLVIGENAPEAELIFVDTVTFEEVSRVNTGAPIQNCAYSDDGSLIATTSPDGVVSLWGVN